MYLDFTFGSDGWSLAISTYSSLHEGGLGARRPSIAPRNLTFNVSTKSYEILMLYVMWLLRSDILGMWNHGRMYGSIIIVSFLCHPTTNGLSSNDEMWPIVAAVSQILHF